MKQRDPRQERNEMTEKMPFQLKLPQVPHFAAISGIERAKLALPIFGGTSPTETTTTTEKKPEEKTTTDPATTGGEAPKTLSPEEAASLLEQISETNKKLEEANKKIEESTKKETAAQRAQMGKEEALTADLEEATKTIIKMDAALKNQAVINAINAVKDIEFHDNNFIMRELQTSAPDIFENMEVDLENGTVTVKGVENHLRRIAKEKEWAVKKNASATTQQQNGNQPPAPPASGAPPANPSTNQDKAARRKSLADKYPVIAHGRRI